MKTAICGLSAGLIFLQLYNVNSLADASAGSTTSVEKIAEHCNRFARDVYSVLARQHGNIFYSSFSLNMVAALTYCGANGTTAQELKSALHLEGDKNSIQEAFKGLIESLNSNVLDIATMVFIVDQFMLDSKFNANSEKYFKSGVQLMDFVHKSEESRKEINRFVEEKTHTKIKELMPQGSIDSSTQMVLVNAIYMNAKWSHPFNPIQTQESSFKLDATNSVPMEMMHVSNRFLYKEDEKLDAKILELPYSEGNLAMVIILPNLIDGLKKLEAKLGDKASNLKFPLEGLISSQVHTVLPKFKLEQTMELKDLLIELGVINLFDARQSDLSGIGHVANRPLSVSNVFQKSYISVNESGTVAAAATGTSTRLMASPRPVDFIADHPFYFTIIHKPTGLQLFQGRICAAL